MARCSIRGAVTEENLKSVRRVRRSGDCGGGWRVDKKPWWKLRRWWGERIEGFGNRFHPRGKPPSFASYVLFEKRSLFYREKKSVRPRSLFFSSPLPLSSPPFLLFSSPRVSAVFFSYPFLLSFSLLRLFLPPLLFFLSRSLSSLFSLFLSLPPWLRVDEREEDSFLCFAGNRFLSYVKLQDGSSTFLPRGSLFLLLPKFIGGNVLFTL